MVRRSNKRSALYQLCYNSNEEHTDASWNNVREWLNANKHNKIQAAANYRGHFNRTPLHIMLRSHPPADLVQILLYHAPETATLMNQYGHLPLHDACAQEACPDIVMMLLQSFPEGAHQQDHIGDLPLHNACVHGSISRDVVRVDVVKMLLQAYPQAVQQQNKYGRLPLHTVCLNGASLELLNVLTEAYPKSIDIKDINNNKPSDWLKLWVNRRDTRGHPNQLHNAECSLRYAVMNVFSVYLVKLLLLAFPEQCITTDENGMTLLHHACTNAATVDSVDVVMALLEANPESSTIADNHGITPSQLLKQFASQREKNGMYSLHHQAARGLLTANSLRVLFEAYPESIVLPDNSGMLPLHHACLNEVSSLDVLMSFVKFCPESILFNL